jgi:hypothetical protein
MAVDIDALGNSMIAAGRTLVGNIWEQMETFAIPELKKIAVQIAALADPTTGWTPEARKLLFRMQVRSAVSVIVAMTSLMMLEVQNAINAILQAVKDVVNTAVGIPLI